MQRCLQLVARHTHSTTPTPWFVDVSNVVRPPNPRLIPPLPENTPSTLKKLYCRLSQSPHLELSTLTVSQPLAPAPGPPLPLRLPRGRRKRGGTYAGESIYDIPGGTWNWVVMAQVKEGTESKGAVGSVVRLVRKTVRDFAMKRNNHKLMSLLAFDYGTAVATGPEQ